MKRYNIGKVKLYHISAGRFSLDGGSMFGIVPKVLWSKKIQSDRDNRISMGANILLVDTGEHLVLVDTGIGYNWDDKFRKLYCIEERDIFKELEITPDDVDLVILTHLHFDHTGGSTYKDQSGNYTPYFPNARYVVQKEEWDYAHSPDEKNRASYIRDRFSSFEKQLYLVDGDTQITEEIKVIRTGGHTIGHQIIVITSEGMTAVFLGDLVPMVYHIHYPYIMAYDNYPLDTLQQKKKLYRQASKDNWLLVFEHDPLPLAGRLYLEGGKPKVLLEV